MSGLLRPYLQNFAAPMTHTPAPRPIQVLHLEDSKVDHELVKFALRRNGLDFDLLRVETLEDFSQALDTRHFDAVLADYHLPGFTALDAWDLLGKARQQPPFIILSGAIGEAPAVDAIRRGMADYVLKDSMHRLEHVLLRAIEMHETKLARQKADAELAASERRLAELTEHLQVSIEQERAAIAREVHDDIGGSLAAVKLDLAWISRQPLDEATRGHLNAALEMLQQALGASQRIMKDLRPAVLDQGLVAAIEWLLASFEKRTGISTRLRCAIHGADLPADLLQVAYRTAQEALTNVSKHAVGATAVSVDLATGSGVLTLEVSDNGQGLQPGALDKADSFGVRGLRERARIVNGWLDVTSGGEGTSVILSLPLSAQHEATAKDVSGDIGSSV